MMEILPKGWKGKWMDREFNPKETPEDILNMGAYVRYRNGKEVSLIYLTVKEIIEAIEVKGNRFFVEESK